MRPSPAELAAAFEAGARVVAGWPAWVPLADGGMAVHDVAHPGHFVGWDEPAPHVTAPWCRQGTTWYVAGQSVGPNDVVAVRDACRLVREAGDPHGAAAEAARIAAGRVCVAIRDAHIRASLLDTLGAWGGVLGALVAATPEDGEMYELADPDIADRARALVVTCPSTGRRYVHLVPTEEAGTPKEAREWILGGPAPEVET